MEYLLVAVEYLQGDTTKKHRNAYGSINYYDKSKKICKSRICK